MEKYIFLSNSPAATSGLGRKMGARLEVGSLIALIGELGCGKTLFTRGICAGLRVSLSQVNSPTFVFVNEYLGKMPVFHMDLYRLGNIDEGFEIGILDYLHRGESGVIVVEWAEKLLSILPDEYLEVNFEVLAGRQRRIAIYGHGRKYRNLIRGLGSY